MGNELKLLLRVEWKRLLDSLNPGRSKSRAGSRKTALFSAVVLAAAGLLIAYAVFYFVLIAQQLQKADAMRVLPELVMAICSFMAVFTSIYKVKGTLFGFGDYDFIMSLPVKTVTVAAAKLLMLYFMNLFFCVFLLLPAGAVYAYYESPGAWFYAAFLLLFPFVPLVPVVIAAVIGAAIHFVSAGFKHSNVVNLAVTLALFVGLMFVSFNTGNFFLNAAKIGGSFTAGFARVYPPAGWYAKALFEGNAVFLLLFIGVSLLTYLLFSYAAASRFKAINTRLAAVAAKSDYRLKELNVSSAFAALYKKELKRFFSSTNYVLNSAVGILLFTIASIAILFGGVDKLAVMMQMAGLKEMLVSFGPVAVSVFIALSCTTACSVSLEGKNLWLVRSLPAPVKLVFLSKIAVNLTLSVTASVINGTIFIIVLKPGLAGALLFYAVPLAYSVFTALMGLAVNLAYPNFSWTNEITVIKQSAAVMIALVIGLAAVAAPIAAIAALKTVHAVWVEAAAAALLACISAVLYRRIMTRGVKTFEAFE
ncbi:MAG TPA: hypothetical protein PL044_09700 [Clostridiales bacterium]|nr:MAG: hypothetical protein BWY37_01768 [Firmicutes bacterium ADurb.Bin262]HQK74026.1 hypothetical protein [Clostridiales bacterium]